MKELHVYSWQGWRHACPPAANGSKQTREIVAAHSKAEVARIVGVSGPRKLFCLGETGNEAELEKALGEPGVVFWCPLDERPRRWRRGKAGDGGR